MKLSENMKQHLSPTKIPPFFYGVKWKLNAKLLRSVLDIVVLRLINEYGSIHGYQIIKTIRQRYSVYFSASTIYPLLAQLKAKGYVKSEWGMAQATNKPIKVYTLTTKGKTMMESSQTELKVIMIPQGTVQQTRTMANEDNIVPHLFLG